MDVHPPHETIHTWRDFLIHIATIVVGLIIALGLEQLVVLIEHHHEIKETRHRLAEERQENIDLFHRNISYMRDTVGMLRGDVRALEYLKAHPGTQPSDLPGVLVWTLSISGIQTTVWDWTEKAPVLELLPQEEVQHDRTLYSILKDSDRRHSEMWDCVTEAGDYRFVQPDITRLTPQQIQTALDRVQVCMRNTFQYAVSLNNVAQYDQDFAPGPSSAEINSFGPSSTLAGISADAYAIAAKDHDEAHVWENFDAMAELTQALTQPSVDPESAYNAVMKKYPAFRPDEESINNLGYAELRATHPQHALWLFKLNTQLYPTSWNAFDSLGEAYVKTGNKQQAIASYEKSLSLNPRNASGAKALAELKK